jgi:hypothetical protein
MVGSVQTPNLIERCDGSNSSGPIWGRLMQSVRYQKCLDSSEHNNFIFILINGKYLKYYRFVDKYLIYHTLFAEYLIYHFDGI